MGKGYILDPKKEVVVVREWSVFCVSPCSCSLFWRATVRWIWQWEGTEKGRLTCLGGLNLSKMENKATTQR